MTIISFKHNYIFIKTRKVAGTSVEAALRQFTGPADIVPCITPRDEYFCASQGLFSKNYAENPDDEHRYTELVLEKKFDQAIQFLKGMKKKYISHMSAEIIKIMLEEQNISYDSFFKFTIERHPYSWLISKNSYDNSKYNSTGEFGEMELETLTIKIKKNLNTEKNINWEMYTKDNQLLVDFIMRYESLQKDLETVLIKLGLRCDLQLAKLKSNSHAIDPKIVLDENLRYLIQEKFHHVFSFMGYEP